VRIRIALSTAVAVIVCPSILFTLFSSSPAAAAAKARHGADSRHHARHGAESRHHARHVAATRHRAVRHEANTRHRSVRFDSKVASYSKAQKAAEAQKAAAAQQAAKLVAYSNAVTKAHEEDFLKEYAFLQEYAYLKAVAAQRAAAAAQAAASSAALPASAPTGSDATSTNTANWACIRQHESGGNYGEGGGGAYQFELGTWHGVTGLSTPAQASPPAVQDAAALRLYSQRGWQPWTTRYVCGL